jgi:hypothetical protein
LLEIIQIQEHKGKGGPVPGGLFNLHAELLKKMPGVVKLRQLVGDAELLVFPLALLEALFRLFQKRPKGRSFSKMNAKGLYRNCTFF